MFHSMLKPLYRINIVQTLSSPGHVAAYVTFNFLHFDVNKTRPPLDRDTET